MHVNSVHSVIVGISLDTRTVTLREAAVQPLSVENPAA
jgi:hypothetical protein